MAAFMTNGHEEGQYFAGENEADREYGLGSPWIGFFFANGPLDKPIIK